MSDLMPQFEGRDVDGSVIKMTGATVVDDLSDVVLGIDDRVQILSTFTVKGVYHDVDKDGRLIRVHVLKPVEAELAPFKGSPDGVLRALPLAALGMSSSSAGGSDE